MLPGSASPILTGPVRSRSGSGSSGPATWGNDVALSADGTRVYVAASAPYEFTVYDAAASALPVVGGLPGALYPAAVEVGSDDRIYCGAANASSSAWVYDASGGLDASYQLGIVTRQKLAVSGDALRIVALTGDGNTSTAVKLVTVAP